MKSGGEGSLICPMQREGKGRGYWKGDLLTRGRGGGRGSTVLEGDLLKRVYCIGRGSLYWKGIYCIGRVLTQTEKGCCIAADIIKEFPNAV